MQEWSCEKVNWVETEMRTIGVNQHLGCSAPKEIFHGIKAYAMLLVGQYSRPLFKIPLDSVA